MADRTCTRCDRTIRSGARFCTQCGTPAPPPGADVTRAPLPLYESPETGDASSRDDAGRASALTGVRSRQRTTALIAGAVAGVAIVCAIVVVLVVSRPAPAAPTPPPTGSSSTTVATPSDTPDPAPTSTETAGEALQRQQAADRPTAEGLVGEWLPQISSKTEGLITAGVTYDDTQILADFERSRAAHPDAILVQSSDFTTFRQPGFWVTLIAQGFTTADGANAWCNRYSYNANDCFAKRLSHTDGPSGNTVPRQ